MIVGVLNRLKEKKENPPEKDNNVATNSSNKEAVDQNGTHSEEKSRSDSSEDVNGSDAPATNEIDGGGVEKSEKLHRVIKRVLTENSDGIPMKKLRKELHKATKRPLEEIDEVLPAKLVKAKVNCMT